MAKYATGTGTGTGTEVQTQQDLNPVLICG